MQEPKILIENKNGFLKNALDIRQTDFTAF